MVFTAAAVLLLDRVDRRPMLIIGISGMVIALTVLGLFFQLPALQQHAGALALVALLLYIAALPWARGRCSG